MFLLNVSVRGCEGKSVSVCMCVWGGGERQWTGGLVDALFVWPALLFYLADFSFLAKESAF